MKQIIALGGEPASGKTSIMRGIIARCGGIEAFQPFKHGLLRGHWCPKEKLFILGIYDDQLFAGTDRLSMAVINDAVSFLHQIRKREDHAGSTMLFEGDRLFNKRFLEECKQTAPTAIMVLDVSEEQKNKRHVKRGDTQTAKWLQSRATKVENLVAQFPETQRYVNENEIQQSRIIFAIFALASRTKVDA